MTNILKGVKTKVAMVVLALVMFFGSLLMIAQPASAGYEYSCGLRGGYTYHTHTYYQLKWWHETYYKAGWNEFWYWDSKVGYDYEGWAYCR